MSKNTKLCVSYLDFIGSNALEYYTINSHSYIKDFCVYALSANMVESDNTRQCHTLNDMVSAALNNFSWNDLLSRNDIRFTKSNDNQFMCYHFVLSNTATESDSEPDFPYSYEELFDQSITGHLSASTAMQYKYIWDAYTGNNSAVKQEMISNFYSTNNVANTAKFDRTDYYKFFVPETEVIHDRSLIELNDNTLASVSNSAHDSFNCLLYCINPLFNKDINGKTYPQGFNTSDIQQVIPVSICTYSQDIILAGNNVVFEPNLNGVVTVE